MEQQHTDEELPLNLSPWATGPSGSWGLAWRRAPGWKASPPTLAQAAHRFVPHWVSPSPKGVPGCVVSLFCWGIPQRPDLHFAGGVTEAPGHREEPMTRPSPGYSPLFLFP